MAIKTFEHQSDSLMDLTQSEPSKMPIPQWARALVLAALASGCATQRNFYKEDNIAPVIGNLTDPIHCSRELKSLHANSLPFTDTPTCDHPVPDALSQTVEFTENIRTKSGKGRPTFNLDTTIKPTTEPADYCRTVKIDRWITQSSNQIVNEWPNEELIGLSLGANKGTPEASDANSLLAEREVRTLAGHGSHTQKTLKGYRIERTPEGIHFQTEIVDCR